MAPQGPVGNPPPLPPPPPAPRDFGAEFGRPTSMRPAGADPAVLVVGAGQAMREGIQAALQARHIFTHAVSAEAALECVKAAAPDLVLLVGDAAADGGREVLAGLAASPSTSVVPVALLADDPALAQRLHAFRHGAIAVIPRSASVDAIAAEVERLVREIPERGGDALGNVGEATLRELVDTLSRELRTGILSVRATAGADGDAVRLVLGGGRPLAEAIDEFVSRLREHVVHAEPLQYEFQEHATGTLQLLGSHSLTGEETEAADIEGVRAVLVDDDAARADAVAQELRRRGAVVVVGSLAPGELEFARLRQLDASIVIVDERTLHSSGYPLMRRMRHDARLRWGSLLVVRWEDLWAPESATPDLDAMAGTIAYLEEPERTLRDRARREASFDVRLESMGPARMIRALATSPHTLRVTVYNPRVVVQIDVADGTVVGATGHTHADSAEVFDGTAALSALLVLSSGRVHVERATHVGNPNVMSTVDVALNMADAVPAPIAPSVPPAAATITGSPPATAAGRGARRGGIAWLVAGLLGLGVLGVGGLFVARALSDAPDPGSAPSASAATPTSAAAAPSVPGSAPPAVADASKPASPDAGASGSAPAPAPEVPAAQLPAGLQQETSVATPTCEALAGALTSMTPVEGLAQSASAMKDARRGLVKGDLESAHRSLCRAALLTPDDPVVVATLVRVLLMRRDGARAVEWSRRGLEKAPRDDNLKALLGDAHARQGSADEAKAIWLESGGARADDLQAIQRLSRRHLRTAVEAEERSDYERAERFYRRAVFLDAEYALAVEGLARALSWLKDYEASVRWARRALELRKSPASQVVLGDALAGLGKLDDARRAYTEALALAPGEKAARRGLDRLPR